MRVLITGGGTAGHVNPALAIADAIARYEKDSVIEYVGTENGLEGKLVKKRGLKLHPLEVYGLKRAISLDNIKALSKAITARKQCKEIIRAFQPDVVIGTGGYVSWPLISAASAMKIPTVLHESNAEPGFAIRTLQKKTDLILINFEQTKEHLKRAKKRVLRVGMPVDRAFYSSEETPLKTVKQGAKEKDAISILSFGGSLGARTVNLAVLRLMKSYLKQHPHITIEHSCGAREFDEISKLLKEEGLDGCPNIILSEYIYDMPEKMKNADLVIARSGASTLAEIAAAGKAAFLIPSPNVTGDQQRKNAAQLAARNAAVVVEDAVAIEALTETVKSLVEEDGQKTMKSLSENVRWFAVRDCAERTVSAIRELIGSD